VRDEKETKMKAAILRSLRIVTLLSAVAVLPMAAHGAFSTDPLPSGGGSSLYSHSFHSPGLGTGPSYSIYEMDADFQVIGGRDSFSYPFDSGHRALDDTKIPVPDGMAPPVPKHGTMFLVGGGLLGIGFWGRRRKRMQ
jgi:hypothetical protein